MILVTGATGHLGKAALEFLLQKKSAGPLAALVRDPAKAQDLKAKGIDVRQGDYNDPTSLVKAFKGVDKLYFVSSDDVVNRIAQHGNVVNAAKEAGVKHVVYTSFQRKNEGPTNPIYEVAKSHSYTEEQLKASGLTYTILKHTIYADMLPVFMGNILETHTIFLPSGNGKVVFATRNDMAEAAANILTSAGHDNKAYEIAGTVPYSYHDVAAILSELTGKKITYTDAEPEAFKQALAKAGVPPVYIDVSAGFSEAIKQGEFDTPDATLEKLLGRKPASVKEYLKTVYSL